jgi:hypothetical protein
MILPLAEAWAGASSSVRRGRATSGQPRCRRPARVVGEEHRRREKAGGGDAVKRNGREEQSRRRGRPAAPEQAGGGGTLARARSQGARGRAGARGRGGSSR